MATPNIHRVIALFTRITSTLVVGILISCGGDNTDEVGGSNSSSSSSSSSSSTGGNTGSSGNPGFDLAVFERGKTAYSANACSACHGPDGSGGVGGPIKDHSCPKNAPNLDCSDIDSLASYIAEAMPQNNAGACVDNATSSCATDIATFMVVEFAPAIVLGDKDGDGIPDTVDLCDTALEDIPSIDSTGCKNVTVSEGTIIAINVGGEQFISQDGTFYQADNAQYYTGSGGIGSGGDGGSIPDLGPDQCNITSQCKAIWPAANDCQNSASATSICMCGTARCDATPIPGIANTEDDALFKALRWGTPNLEYRIPVAKGEYEIDLHFNENFHSAAGLRIIDVQVEGRTLIETLDIYSKAGGKNFALTESLSSVSVTDGTLNIALRGTTHNGAISAIKIVGTSSNDGDGDGIPDKSDDCPGTLPAVDIDQAGCSNAQLDKDGDGILIPEDVCPQTPSNEIGSVSMTGSLAGCSANERSIDTDNDGVPDIVDKCVSVPGETVGSTGCSGISDLPQDNIISPQMRLTERELKATVMSAFEINALPEVTYQGDAKGPFDKFTNNAAESSADFETLVSSAQTLAKSLASNYANRCNWFAQPRQCVNDLLSDPIKKLYRIDDLSNTDLQAIADVITEAFNAEATVEQAVSVGIVRAIIDDRTIYQLEKGIGTSSFAGTSLTTREFIDRLSFFLTDSPPDSTLVDVQNNLLGNTSNVASQAERLQDSEAFSEVV